MKMLASISLVKKKYCPNTHTIPPPPPSHPLPTKTTYSKVDAGDAIHDNDVGVSQLGEAEACPNTPPPPPPPPPHQTKITYSEVDAGDAIHDNEDVGVGQLGEAEVQPHRKHEDQKLQVEVEGGPGGGLVLRHRGDDGDVVLGIGRVQQGVETSSPGRDFLQSS